MITPWFWQFIFPSKLKFKQRNKITIHPKCCHKKAQVCYYQLPSKLDPSILPPYLHWSIFPVLPPQIFFVFSVLASRHIFSSEREYWFGFGRISQAFLNWDKVSSWSQPGSGDSDASCWCHSYNSHQYFSPHLKDGTSNLLYCSNWCYSEKLFLPEPATLLEGNWHLTRNIWLSKWCNSIPISISKRIKINFKKEGLSSMPTTDSPKRCYIPQLIPNWIKPFLLKKVTAI